MIPGAIEDLAKRAALGNNGGDWAQHYTDEQKEHWRSFARDLMAHALTSVAMTVEKNLSDALRRVGK